MKIVLVRILALVIFAAHITDFIIQNVFTVIGTGDKWFFPYILIYGFVLPLVLVFVAIMYEINRTKISTQNISGYIRFCLPTPWTIYCALYLMYTLISVAILASQHRNGLHLIYIGSLLYLFNSGYFFSKHLEYRSAQKNYESPLNNNC